MILCNLEQRRDSVSGMMPAAHRRTRPMPKNAIRTSHLRTTLLERRRDIETEVRQRVRRGRTSQSAEGCDDMEDSEADTQGDIAFMLLQMKAETLRRIDSALAQLDKGKYGSCFECDADISEQRLRALPFAVRCQSCEEAREVAQGQARIADRRNNVSAFPLFAGS
jgi:DnaK suppressor protein